MDSGVVCLWGPMKTLSLLLLAAISILINASCSSDPAFERDVEEPSIVDSEIPPPWVRTSKADAKILISEKLSLPVDALVVCSSGISWLVVDLRTLEEFYVGKTNNNYLGSILRNFDSPIRYSIQPVLDPVVTAKAAAQRAAIFINNEVVDSFKPLDWEKHQYPEVCELPDRWRVEFPPRQIRSVVTEEDFNRLPNYNPFIVILDKKDGRVLYFNFKEQLKTRADD